MMLLAAWLSSMILVAPFALYMLPKYRQPENHFTPFQAVLLCVWTAILLSFIPTFVVYNVMLIML